MVSMSGRIAAAGARGAVNASTLLERLEIVLEEARRGGADAAQATISRGTGLTAGVRLGNVESVEHEDDRSASITVYRGRRCGTSSTTDLGERALRDTVRSACIISRYTAEDNCNGLAEPELMPRELPGLDLEHPWELSPPAAIDLALEMEAAALEADPDIRNTDGVSVETYRGVYAYGNTHGFAGSVCWTRHGMNCTVIAGQGQDMQSEGWHDTRCDPGALMPPERIGRIAAARALARLKPRRVPSRPTSVIFEAPAAVSLFSNLVRALSGSNLYRQTSFLLGRLGQEVFSPRLVVREEPRLPKALGSASFDGEGVATRAKDIAREGVLRSYLLDSYSARKLGMASTGNAGGVHNLIVEPGPLDLSGMLRHMDTGVLVTDLLGFGSNLVTGDYSQGVAGFWVQGGEKQYPIEEVTVAGNLVDMLKNVEEIGGDVDERGNVRTGSTLISGMTLAGR